MNPVVVMVTVSDRVKYLNAFLRSYVEFGPGWPVYIHMQDPDGRFEEIVYPKGLEVGTMVTPVPIGCHAARIMVLQALEGLGFDGYLNVDDDVLLTPHTRWAPAMRYAAEPGVGFVLTNWVRTPELYHEAIDRITHAVAPQVMVYQGGGQAYREPVADLIRALDPIPARYDDLWPLTSYVAGYANYRYQGSLSVHQTLGKGGMQKFMAEEPRQLLGWKYVDYPRLETTRVGSEYGIPLDQHLRERTRQLHREARMMKGWPMRGAQDSHPKLAPLEQGELFSSELVHALEMEGIE